MYIREYREDGKLVVRAIPFPEDRADSRPAPPLLDLKQKVS
ncbi:hypothetical protein [Holophaga foetida]|nr:hypothetical protein [Holophaga foetida]